MTKDNVHVKGIKTCYQCIGDESFTKDKLNYACLDSWGSQTGTCCKFESSPWFEDPNNVYACGRIDKTKNSLCSIGMTGDSTLKYAFCPYDERKCIGGAMGIAHADTARVLSTSYAFRDKDSCAFKLTPTDSQLYFSRQLNVTVNLQIDMNCKIYHGESLSQLESNVIDCSGKNASTYTITATHYAVIVVKGKSDDAFIEIQYELSNYLDTFTLAAIVCLGLLLLACFVALYTSFILTKSTKVAFEKQRGSMKDAGIQMSVEVSRIKAATDDY